MEKWNDGRLEDWKIGGIRLRKGMMEKWNVEVLAEIPLWREQDGKHYNIWD